MTKITDLWRQALLPDLGSRRIFRMKTTITLVFLFFVQISFAQNYFNTISSKEKKDKVEIQIPTEVKESKRTEVKEPKQKSKEFYITITQKLKNEVLSTNLIQKRKDSIYNYKFINIDLFNTIYRQDILNHSSINFISGGGICKITKN